MLFFTIQVKLYATIAFRLSLLGLGLVCVYFTSKELFPGRLGPQGLFSEAFERVRNHEEVMVMAGANMKAFGRDVGRNEGRRNHVDSYSYTAEDGSKRTRIRFNVKGDKGKVIVWVEVRTFEFFKSGFLRLPPFDVAWCGAITLWWICIELRAHVFVSPLSRYTVLL